MAEDFLGLFMGNAVRAKIMRSFAFSESESFTLARMAKRAAAPATVIGKELRALEHWGVIKKGRVVITLKNGKNATAGKQKEETWVINPHFKHLSAIIKFVHEVSPVHRQSILNALKRAGRLSAVVLSGNFVGDSGRPADLIVVSNSLNEQKLEGAVRRLESSFGREIRYVLLTVPEFRYRLTIKDRLLRDTLDYPHVVLLDRPGIFQK